MNNLNKNLRFYELGECALVQEPFSFTSSVDTIYHANERRIYTLSATVEERVVLDPLVLSSSAIEDVKQRMRDNINFGVHSGYMEPLQDLRRHLYKRGDLEGAAKVNRIIDEMFYQ